MKEYFLQMMSTRGTTSLMRHIVLAIVIIALICAVANIFVEKDLTAMVVGMLAAAGVSKGFQSFAER
jgi:hypothetical protein